MNNRQLEELGIDKATAKKILKIHGKDRVKLIEKIEADREPEECNNLRNAITAILQLITSKNALVTVFNCCTYKVRDEYKKTKDGGKMAYYKQCENCGAYLDPEEICECKKEQAKAIPTTTNQADAAPAQAPHKS